MYGKYFKQLRINQDISLREAAKKVISISQLSRWENDKSSISFETVIKLLNNIHIQANEFVSYCQFNPVNPLINEITKAYQNKDVTKLKELTLQQIQLTRTSKNRFDLFLEVTAANFYFNLTNILLISENDILKVKSTLSSTSFWNYYYTSVWGNTLALYDSQFNFKIASRILIVLKTKRHPGYDIKFYTWCTVINALICMIPDDIQLAEKLSDKIEQIGIPEMYSSIKLKKKFMDIYIKYQLHKSTKEELNNFLYSLENLGLNNLKNELQYFINHTTIKN